MPDVIDTCTKIAEEPLLDAKQFFFKKARLPYLDFLSPIEPHANDPR